MTPEELQNLKIAIATSAELCSRPLSDAAIKVYAEHLSQLPFEKVMLALTTLVKRAKFPSIQEIEELVSPELSLKDNAKEIASLAVSAVAKFGWPNPNQARSYMGETAWSAVERFGGWLHFCETLNAFNQANITAQLRDLAETLVKQKHVNLAYSPPETTNKNKPHEINYEENHE